MSRERRRIVHAPDHAGPTTIDACAVSQHNFLMTRLFSAMDTLERLPIPDAHVYYLPALDLGRPAADVLEELIRELAWKAEEIVLMGKKHAQPRLTAWYGDAECSYTYSGLRLEPLPWTSTLLHIKQAVEIASSEQFNSVLANYYRDHRDSMGFHSDDEPELGPQPVIASVSLGERRTFVLRPRRRKDLAAVRIDLESASLLLMKGDTQRNWKHGIEKQTRPCGPRVNLTFRRILQTSR